jgi:uncharacterized membrane protein
LRPEKVFLVLSLCFGLSLWLIVPPFQAPDEEQHLFRAYQVSEGILVPENSGLVSLPMGFRRLYQELSRDLEHEPDNKARLADTWTARKIPLEPDNRLLIVCRAGSYGPHAYAVPALSMFVGRSLGLGPLSLYYAGRLSSLLLFIALIYCSIRVTPVLKWIFCLLGLMPMNMFLAASFSADAVTNSLAFLFSAFVFDLAFTPEKELKGETVLPIVLVGALLSCCKLGGYSPMLALIFLIPARKASSFRKYVSYLALTFVTGMAGVALWIYLSRHDVFPNYGQAAHDFAGQGFSNLFSQIMEHPFFHLRLVAHTTIVQIRGYFQQFVGVLGWLDTVLPAWIRYGYLSMLAGVALVDHSRQLDVRVWQKVVAILTAGVTYFCIQTIMYMINSPPGRPLIFGFQGRYLIPLAPALFLLFYNRKFVFKSPLKSLAKLVVCCWILMSIFGTVWVVTSRYYSPGLEYLRMSFGLRPVHDARLQVEIYSSTEFSQTFLSLRNGLTGMSILIKGFQVPRSEKITPYKLALKDRESGAVIREVRLDPSGLVGWNYVDILFDSIENSKDREYSFTIVPTTAKVETPIRVILSEPRAYPEGRTVVRGKNTDRTVVFKLIFKAEE